MHNILYISKNIDLPLSIKEAYKDDIVFAAEFSPAIASYSGIIIGSDEINNKNTERIKSSNYPIIIWPGADKKRNSKNFEKDGKNLNIYFSFKSVPAKNIFSQVIKNYVDVLTEKKNKQLFEDRFSSQEKLNQELLNIGVALSAERNNSKLLNYIMVKACEITKADAGSLYLLDVDKATGQSSMIFKISHNDSNKTDFTEFRMPLLKKSIAGYVAITGKALKLDDAYSIPKDAEYGFNKSYDESTGYRTKSMLTVPMKNHKDKIIGVIQLINKKKERTIILSDHQAVEEGVIPFNKLDEEIILSLSSLAAVSLDNNLLYNEIQELFECLVSASAKAIEQRDPATSGHSARVAQYTVALAEAVALEKERFNGVTFSEEHLKGLKFASLLHDFGKVGVRENVLVKAKKLYPGMLEQILLRLDNIVSNIKLKTLETKFALDPEDASYNKEIKELDSRESAEIAKIDKYRDAIIKANEPTVLDSAPEHILAEIKNDKKNNILSNTELEYLSVKKGSLTKKEREEIMLHASHTYDFLKNIPWPESMEWIPEVARWHHESIDGSGYPDGKKMGELPLDSRLMAVADVFDALTSSDRPYKKSITPEEALKILKEEAKRGKLDSNVVDIFIKREVYKVAGLN